MGLPTVINPLASNANYYQWYGGFGSGSFGATTTTYLIPSENAYFTSINPADFASLTSLNLATVNSNWSDFFGGFTDGRYGYLMNQTGGDVVRVDLQTFPSTAGVTSININGIDPTDGDFYYLNYSATDGVYGYTASQSNAKLGRFNLGNFNASNALMLDLRPLLPQTPGFEAPGMWLDAEDTTVYGLWVNTQGPDTWLTATATSNFTVAGTRILTLTPYGNAFQSFQLVGDYLYAISYVSNPTGATASGVIVKIDKKTLTVVKSLDLGAINAKYVGFYSSFTDAFGRFLYLSPRVNTVLVRIDLNDFQSIDALDLSPFGINGACHGAFSDGRYGFITQLIDPANPPYNRAGRVARFQLFNAGHA